jgi:IS30 family transposase
VQSYFADPHSAWKYDSNGTTDGLLRKYNDQWIKPSIYSQNELDDIALP